MNAPMDRTRVEEKLMGPVSDIVNKHVADIVPLLQGSSADLTRSALKNDDTVRTVATFCYALLPGLARLAVKEPSFVLFVMNNREKILGKLVESQAASTPAQRLV